MSPFVWLGVAAVMGVVEIVSLSLITMWFVVGALVAVSYTHLPELADAFARAALAQDAEVFELAPEKIPGDSGMAALYRY